MEKIHTWLSLLLAVTMPTTAMAAYTAPFSFTPTQAQFNECVVEDVDGDGVVTTYDSSESAFKHGMSMGGIISDDYLFMPAITLQPGSYKLLFDFKTKSDKENFAICLATAPSSASVTQVITAKEDVTKTEYTTETSTFDIATAGDYHLAIHVYSPNGRWNMWWRNFRLTAIDDALPQVPQLSAVADGLDVTVTVTLPAKQINGNALSGSLNANISVDGETVKTLNGAPGATVSDVITCTSGVHQIGASVTATVGGVEKTSEIVTADIETYRKCPDPMTVPVALAPDYDEFTWATVINNNDDSSTWQFANSGMPEPVTTAVRYSSSWASDGDDYFVLPATQFAAGAYEISVEMGTKYHEESFEIYVGGQPTVESLTQNKIASFSKNLNDSWEHVKTRLIVTEATRLHVAFKATSPSNQSYLYLRDFRIDAIDASMPAMPGIEAEFDGGDGNLNITLPATDLMGNALPVTTVYATVTLDGNTAETPVSGAPGTMVAVPCTGLAKGEHTASVRAYIERDGDKVYTEEALTTFTVGLPSTFAYEMPVTLSLAEDMFADMVLLDANGDGTTWTAQPDAIKYGYNTSNGGDDWLFTAPVDIEQIDFLVYIAIEAKCHSSNYDEGFEIWLGSAQTPETMTMKILDVPALKNSEYTTQSEDFMISTPGRYILGIHEISGANKYGLYLKNLQLTYTDKPNTTPGCATDIVAQGNITGALDATVTFTMPATNVPGEPLDPDTQLTATVTSPLETQTVTGLPGTEQQVTVACNEGENQIKIVVANADGDGKAAYTTARCGLDKPKTPVITKAVVSDDNCTLHIEWEPVTQGQTGGNVNPDGIDYYLWEYDPDDEDWYQLDVFNTTSYDYTLSDDWKSSLSHIIVGVQAYNGRNSGSGFAPAEAVLGKPYDLMMADDFAGFRFAYKPVTLSSTLQEEYRPEWGLGDPASFVSTAVSANGAALVGRTTFNRGDSYVIMPKFSTAGMPEVDARFSVYVYPVAPQYTLVYRDAEGRFNEIESFNMTGIDAGWHDFTVHLPQELTDKPWVELALFVNFVNGSTSHALIDSYKIGSPTDVAINAAEKDSNLEIIPVEGGVIVTGAAGKTVTVYSTDGRAVCVTTPSADRTSISLAPGIYLVAAGNSGKTVAVR